MLKKIETFFIEAEIKINIVLSYFKTTIYFRTFFIFIISLILTILGLGIVFKYGIDIPYTGFIGIIKFLIAFSIIFILVSFLDYFFFYLFIKDTIEALRKDSIKKGKKLLVLNRIKEGLEDLYKTIQNLMEDIKDKERVIDKYNEIKKEYFKIFELIDFYIDTYILKAKKGESIIFSISRIYGKQNF